MNPPLPPPPKDRLVVDGAIVMLASSTSTSTSTTIFTFEAVTITHRFTDRAPTVNIAIMTAFNAVFHGIPVSALGPATSTLAFLSSWKFTAIAAANVISDGVFISRAVSTVSVHVSVMRPITIAITISDAIFAISYSRR